jgi:tetratricopeptide (TPR) repeat protein
MSSMRLSGLLDKARAALEAEANNKELKRIFDDMGEALNEYIHLEDEDRDFSLIYSSEDVMKSLERKISGNVEETVTDGGAHSIPDDFWDDVDNERLSITDLIEIMEESYYVEKDNEKAERLAINILKINPGSKRAKGILNKIEGSTDSPSDIPYEAERYFLGAQSAGRIGRYQDALNALNRALDIAKREGFHQWEEADNYLLDLQEEQSIEEMFIDGRKDFKNGNIEEAIDKLEKVVQISAMTPRFKVELDKIKNVKIELEEIKRIIRQEDKNVSKLIEAKKSLDEFISNYSDQGMFAKILNLLDITIGKLGPQIENDLTSLIDKATYSASITDGVLATEKAKTLLEDYTNLGKQLISGNSLSNEINILHNDFNRYQKSIQSASKIIDSRSGPFYLDSLRMSKEIRKMFPNDPKVSLLNQRLRVTKFTISSIWTIVLGTISTLVFMGITTIYSNIDAKNIEIVKTEDAYNIGLTPSPTITPTPITPTVTLTPLPSITPTPLPLKGIVIGDSAPWLKNGCYNLFTGPITVPIGTTVTFLAFDPNTQIKDDINRECIRIEFTAFNGNIYSGYLLLNNIQIINRDD